MIGILLKIQMSTFNLFNLVCHYLGKFGFTRVPFYDNRVTF